jgi:rhodanese-related sulfurtransferase
MSPFVAATLAAAWLAAPAAIFAWLRTRRPSHVLRLLSRGAQVVDVGHPEEYAEGHIDGALNVPSEELALRQEELGDHRRPVITYARTRLRSALAAQTLRGIGFHEVFSMGTLKGVKTWATDLCLDAHPSTVTR